MVLLSIFEFFEAVVVWPLLEVLTELLPLLYEVVRHFVIDLSEENVGLW